MEMTIDFCDYDDGRGNVCNRYPEIVVKKKNHTIYLCKRCLYMIDVDPDTDKVAYFSQYGREKNA